jgi:hypothetical protein
VIGGHGKGWGYAQPAPGEPAPAYEGNHAWNAVVLDDGGWHLLDACWGAGVLDTGGTYTARFAPEHFLASNADFGLRHFPAPAEPWKQHVARPLSWEEYMLGPERAKVTGDFGALGYALHLLEPRYKSIPPGRTRFRLKLGCEHVVEREEDGYVPIVECADADKDALKHDGVNGGWSITVNARPGETIRIAVVKLINGEDALGVGRYEYEGARGRRSMQWNYLAEWTVE